MHPLSIEPVSAWLFEDNGIEILGRRFARILAATIWHKVVPMGNEIFFFFFFILSQPLDVLVTAYDKYPAIENRSNAGNFFFFFEMIRRNVNALNTTEENIYVSFNLMLISFSIRDNFEYFWTIFRKK